MASESGTKQDTDNLAKAAGAVQGSKNLDVAGEKMASAIKQLDDKKPKERFRKWRQRWKN